MAKCYETTRRGIDFHVIIVFGRRKLLFAPVIRGPLGLPCIVCQPVSLSPPLKQECQAEATLHARTAAVRFTSLTWSDEGLYVTLPTEATCVGFNALYNDTVGMNP